MIIEEVVDLPQPDSPTSPTLSPERISRLTPFTARVPSAKVFSSPSTRRSGAPISGRAGAGVGVSRRSRSSAPGRAVAFISLRV